MTQFEEENFCYTKAFKVIPHLPCEIPTDFHRPRFYLNYQDVLNLEVRAKSIRTDDSVRNVALNQRNCYFEGERKLKFFKFYSRPHCILECKANITFRKCGCVKFHMPRDKDTPVCNYFEMNCVFNHYKAGMAVYSEEELLACTCHSPCNDIKYSFEVLHKAEDAFLTGKKRM